MKPVISITESLKCAGNDGRHVHASAIARYDEETSELVVQLEVSRRESDANGKTFCPMTETVREKTSLADASEVAHDIFQSWIKKLVKTGQMAIET